MTKELRFEIILHSTKSETFTFIWDKKIDIQLGKEMTEDDYHKLVCPEIHKIIESEEIFEWDNRRIDSIEIVISDLTNRISPVHYERIRPFVYNIQIEISKHYLKTSAKVEKYLFKLFSTPNNNDLIHTKENLAFEKALYPESNFCITNKTVRVQQKKYHYNVVIKVTAKEYQDTNTQEDDQG